MEFCIDTTLTPAVLAMRIHQRRISMWYDKGEKQNKNRIFENHHCPMMVAQRRAVQNRLIRRVCINDQRSPTSMASRLFLCPASSCI